MQSPDNYQQQKIDKLIKALGIDLEFTGKEIAEILWLSLKRQELMEIEDKSKNQTSIDDQNDNNNTIDNSLSSDSIREITSSGQSSETLHQTTHIYADITETEERKGYSEQSLPLRIPDAPSIAKPLEFAKALRPLMQKVSSGRNTILDEIETVEYTAKNGICVPILKAEPEPWLDLVLVVDEYKSMTLWQHTINELQQLLKHYGIFREVKICGLSSVNSYQLTAIEEKKNSQKTENNQENEDNREKILLRLGVGKQQHLANPQELIDPTGRRLILIVSDCVAPFWHDGGILPILREWVKYQPLAIVQMLPDWMWRRTGLRIGASVQFKNLVPGNSNQKLIIKELLFWKNIPLEQGIKIPVLTLEPQLAQAWSQMVVGKHDALASGFVLPAEFRTKSENLPQNKVEQLDAAKRIHRFRKNASPVARKLASLLSAAPMICLPVVRIIQASLLPQAQPVHIAEVFLGGLLKPKIDITPDTNSEQVEYQFVDEEIRQILFKDAPVSDSQQVFDAVSQYLQKHFGKSLKDFVALLKLPQKNGKTAPAFAEVAFELLKQLGGDYAEFAKNLETISSESNINQHIDTDLQTCTFDVATIEIEETDTQIFEFTVATLERQQKQSTHQEEQEEEQVQWVINREQRQAEGIIEVLAEGIELELMLIPGGTFYMGAPEGEEGSYESERPQHQVTVPSFYMGRFQVTQAQWKAIAARKDLKVNTDLNPDPSSFKEDPPQPPLKSRGEKAKTRWDRPVEGVNWYEAKEFCARLSKLTGKQYRLPTEAEWEYACRASQKSSRGARLAPESQKEEITLEEWNEQYNQPFHFGETISTELANYDGNYTYGDGVKCEYREQTTPVGYFGVANAFGLYDMHGNVWEWCEDDYHSNYNDAPTDGSAWLTGDKNTTKILRGGSWDYNPKLCRSAYRDDDDPDDRNDRGLGFRVVGLVSRTL